MDKHPGHEIDIFTLNGYPYKGHIINHQQVVGGWFCWFCL